MSAQETRKQILNAALDLFSQKGYEAVSVQEIASAIGIKAPSLYNHFKSKQEIFDALITEAQKQYDEQTNKMNVHFSAPEKDGSYFASMLPEELSKQVKTVFSYKLHDEYVSKERKLLSNEQYHSKEIAKLYTKLYYDAPINYHTALFELLIKEGVLKSGNTHIMAIEYVSPLLLLLSVCDREPEKEKQALEIIEKHIYQFVSMYGAEK